MMLRSMVVANVVLFSCGTNLFAVTINVPADQGTIQAGIDIAVSGVDEVVVAPGTYFETINFLGKEITVRSSSNNPANTIINGTGNLHVVQCISSETVNTVLQGFTITDGNANGVHLERAPGCGV